MAFERGGREAERGSSSNAMSRKLSQVDIDGTEERVLMNKGRYLFAIVVSGLLLNGVASAQQYPIMDQIANKVIQKYRNSSCEQLWQQRGQPRSPREQQAIQALRDDPQMRAAFIDRVAAPIANKMFECGLLP